MHRGGVEIGALVEGGRDHGGREGRRGLWETAGQRSARFKMGAGEAVEAPLDFDNLPLRTTRAASS